VLTTRVFVSASRTVERPASTCVRPSTRDTARRAAARRTVGDLLGVRVLGSRAVRIARNAASDPVGLLAVANPPTQYVNCLDSYRYFRVRGLTVGGFLTALRPPPQMRLSSVSQVTGRGGRLLFGSDRFVVSSARAGVVAAGIAVSAGSARGGGVAVRVDYWAVWPAVRPTWERLPGGITAIRVSERTSVRGHAQRLATLTAPKQIGVADRTLDRLHVVEPTLPIPGARSCLLSFRPYFELQFYGTRSRKPRADLAQDGCSGLRFTSLGRAGPTLVDSAGGVTATLGLLWHLGAIKRCRASELDGTAANFFNNQHIATAAITINYSGNLTCVLDAISSAHLVFGPTAAVQRAQPSEATLTALAPRVPALLLLNWHRTGQHCSPTPATRLQVTFRDERTPVNIDLRSLTPEVLPCGNSVPLTGPGPAPPGIP
jgi:hypothetical protein